jgi:uncharacterized membrane protein YhaH (DUF805 family)
MALGGLLATLVRRAPPNTSESTPVSAILQTQIKRNPFGHYLFVLKHYAIFSGRAGRAEYWWFFLFNYLLIPIALLSLEVSWQLYHGGPMPTINTSIPVSLYRLTTLIPTIAVGIRRMHDTNHNGWWLLFPFVNLGFAVTAGDKAQNRFGPDPTPQTSPSI